MKAQHPSASSLHEGAKQTVDAANLKWLQEFEEKIAQLPQGSTISDRVKLIDQDFSLNTVSELMHFANEKGRSKATAALGTRATELEDRAKQIILDEERLAEEKRLKKQKQYKKREEKLLDKKKGASNQPKRLQKLHIKLLVNRLKAAVISDDDISFLNLLSDEELSQMRERTSDNEALTEIIDFEQTMRKTYS